jgi:hypothetical protein
MSAICSEIGHTVSVMRRREAAPRPPVRVQPDGGEPGNPWPTPRPESERNLVLKRIHLRGKPASAKPLQDR